MADNAPAVQAFQFANGDGDQDMDDDGPEIMRVRELAALPASVRRRVRGARKLQIDVLNVEAEFYKEVHALECKYQTRMEQLNDRRAAFVNGKEEPDDTEAAFPLFTTQETELSQKFDEQLRLLKHDEADENIKGIPEFWIKVLQNVEVTSEAIQTADEPILRHLTDIKVKLQDDPMQFTLEFHFSPNEWFTNAVLTKTYKMQCVVDESDPADFDGPEIVTCVGDTIQWKEDKNVTVKLVKKKQKNKKQPAQSRFVTKQVKADSFFNFFAPPDHENGVNDQNLDDDDRMLLHMDFEIGQAFRDHIVPHALFHYTQEATDGMDDDSELDDEDDDESDDGDDY